MLKIKGLEVQFNGKKIIKKIDLNINAGEVHVIMGPNGAGKSTLARVLSGHPEYLVKRGSVTFKWKGKSINLLSLSADERAKRGIFVSNQYPVEVPGINNADFLRAVVGEIRKFNNKSPLDPMEFRDLLEEKMELLKINKDFQNRSLNVGFSGGEKKKNEILQMALMEPSLVVLDEIDSGLDVDALKLVTEGIKKIRTLNMSFIIITHYHKMLDYIKPDYVHILKNGELIKSGGANLANEIEKFGFDTKQIC